MPKKPSRFPFAAVVALLLLGLIVWVLQYVFLPIETARLPRDVTVSAGQPMAGVARRLNEGGLLPDAWRFVWLARLSGQANKIKAGVYRISKPLSPWQLLKVLTDGDSSIVSFTIIEGWSWRQLRLALKQAPHLLPESQQLGDQELAQRLGLPNAAVEGWFFPDTYHIAKGSSDLMLLRRAHETMLKRLDAAWQQRAAGLPYKDRYEALIMASIVEKETGHPEDRAMISAVFVNRLKKNMRLQTDPTVIYGLAERFDGNLRKVDLLTDTPYNSYTRSGLPPTPIAMPGMASIAAALNPADSNALYFVAKGDGRSVFSDTLAAHNAAVNTYQRRRRAQ